jgi:hypothetical protein
MTKIFVWKQSQPREGNHGENGPRMRMIFLNEEQKGKKK